MQLRKLLTEADRLMEVGATAEAHAILKKLLEESSLSRGVYADIVYIYLSGFMYPEAKAAIERCKTLTGREPPVELSLQEIEAEELNHASQIEMYSRSELKIFRRMSLKERGHMSNYPTIWPIKEIVISDDGITLVRKGRKYRYQWNEIGGAYTIREEGMTRFARIIKTVMVLVTPDQKFTFDISANFPDFQNSRILVSELQKHLTIKQGALKKNETSWIMIIVAVILSWITLTVAVFLFGALKYWYGGFGGQ